MPPDLHPAGDEPIAAASAVTLVLDATTVTVWIGARLTDEDAYLRAWVHLGTLLGELEDAEDIEWPTEGDDAA